MTASRLKEIMDTVRQQSDLKPVVDAQGRVLTTFCNIGLDRVLGLCGIPRMVDAVGQPLMANAMIDSMRANSDRWTPVSGDVACARASQGLLVVACQQEAGHGHVCPVYPAAMQMSGSYGKDVPMVSNIGRTVGVMRVSQAFKTEPEYYASKI